MRTTAITMTAVAAAIVLVMLRFGPDLRTQLGTDDHGLAQSELAADGDEQGGDSIERRAPADAPSVRDVSVVAPPAIAPVEDAPIVVEDTGPAEPIASLRKPAAKSIAQGSAGDMLAKARAHTRARELGRAVAVYEALIDAYPTTAEARAACVSLGRVQLQRGRAKPALRAFDRYLAGGSGSLGEEAHWGRIQALHALGRAKERDTAIAAFAKAFAGSVYLPKAKTLAGARP
jgi:tetratricopeptide (TPR) repeat protein